MSISESTASIEGGSNWDEMNKYWMKSSAHAQKHIIRFALTRLGFEFSGGAFPPAKTTE